MQVIATSNPYLDVDDGPSGAGGFQPSATMEILANADSQNLSGYAN